MGARDLGSAAKEIPTKGFLGKLRDTHFDSLHNDLEFSYTSEQGRVARFRPLNYWLTDNVLELFASYKPKQFDSVNFGDREIEWVQSLRLRKALCDSSGQDRDLREVRLAMGRIVGRPIEAWRNVGKLRKHWTSTHSDPEGLTAEQ
jgi:hypothetical protein